MTGPLDSFRRDLLITQGCCADIDNLLQTEVAANVDIQIKAQACRAAKNLAREKRGRACFNQLLVCERIVALLKDRKTSSSYDIHLNGIRALANLALNKRMQTLIIQAVSQAFTGCATQYHPTPKMSTQKHVCTILLQTLDVGYLRTDFVHYGAT